MISRDARLEELEYLGELERNWEGKTEKHPTDTPLRRMVADLILAGFLNGASYFSQLGENTVRSGNPASFQRCLDGNRVRDIGLLLKGEEIQVKISHQGRIRKYELEQQLRSGREKEPFGILISRRHLQTDLTIALLKCHANAPVSVAILDMNGLKPINDDYGHGAGDDAIKSYLLAIGTVLQASGEAYRGDGGDEVYVIIPALPFTKATEIARNILRQINKEQIAASPNQRLSASCGLAWTDDPQGSLDTLLKRADDLQYEAKKASKGTSTRTSCLALQDKKEIEWIDP